MKRLKSIIKFTAELCIALLELFIGLMQLLWALFKDLFSAFASIFARVIFIRAIPGPYHIGILQLFDELVDFFHNKKTSKKSDKKVKFLSMDTFVLGGLLGSFLHFWAYFDFQIGVMIHIIEFIMFLILVCCGTFFQFVVSIVREHPKMAYYLASLAWLPCFVIVDFILIFNYKGNSFDDWGYWSLWISVLGIIGSLLIAFIRKVKRKAQR